MIPSFPPPPAHNPIMDLSQIIPPKSSASSSSSQRSSVTVSPPSLSSSSSTSKMDKANLELELTALRTDKAVLQKWIQDNCGTIAWSKWLMEQVYSGRISSQYRQSLPDAKDKQIIALQKKIQLLHAEIDRQRRWVEEKYGIEARLSMEIQSEPQQASSSSHFS